MKEYKIEEQILNGVIQYLSTKPYAEVFKIMSVLSKLEEIKEDENGKLSCNDPK